MISFHPFYRQIAIKIDASFASKTLCVFLRQSPSYIKTSSMKASFHFPLFALLVCSTVFAEAQQLNKLSPAKGHYKQLSSFSPAGTDAGGEIDKLRFQTDQATIDRRMSLKPIYLVG